MYRDSRNVYSGALGGRSRGCTDYAITPLATPDAEKGNLRGDKRLIISRNNVSLLMIAIPPRVRVQVHRALINPAIPVVQRPLTVVSSNLIVVIHGVLIAVVSCRPAVLMVHYRLSLVHCLAMVHCCPWLLIVVYCAS